jgi:hypothetical protein
MPRVSKAPTITPDTGVPLKLLGFLFLGLLFAVLLAMLLFALPLPGTRSHANLEL